MITARRVRVGKLPDIARVCLRQVHGGQKPKQPIGFQGPEGHGEKIWVFAHRRSEQIIYSFQDKLDGFHDLKQLPFNGKKTKPAKLRKDYWSPMARIEFPKGAGAVGRTVFQKLRELKHLHEVSWGDGLLFKQPIEYTEQEKRSAAQRSSEGKSFRAMRTKAERGMALNRQKANAIADMAAVLGGDGPGNKIRQVAGEGEEKLMEVTVSWSSTQDMGYAETWSENVMHTILEDPAEGTQLPAEAETTTLSG